MLKLFSLLIFGFLAFPASSFATGIPADISTPPTHLPVMSKTHQIVHFSYNDEWIALDFNHWESYIKFGASGWDQYINTADRDFYLFDVQSDLWITCMVDNVLTGNCLSSPNYEVFNYNNLVLDNIIFSNLSIENPLTLYHNQSPPVDAIFLNDIIDNFYTGSPPTIIPAVVFSPVSGDPFENILNVTFDDFEIALINPLPSPTFPVILSLEPDVAFSLAFRFRFPEDSRPISYRYVLSDADGSNPLLSPSFPLVSSLISGEKIDFIDVPSVVGETRQLVVHLMGSDGEILADDYIQVSYYLTYTGSVDGQSSIGSYIIEQQDTVVTAQCDGLWCDLFVPDFGYLHLYVQTELSDMREQYPFFRFTFYAVDRIDLLIDPELCAPRLFDADIFELCAIAEPLQLPMKAFVWVAFAFSISRYITKTIFHKTTS